MNTVLAHGCFDLLHLGHIMHLQEARKMGDRLVVSVTDDKYVAKGHGRPHFNAEQRAQALRALACVDEVIINKETADATAVIAKLKPDIYIKGVDWAEKSDHPALVREREAVEAVGGKLCFTLTEKFSSSALLRSQVFPPETVQYLEQCKAAGLRDKILAGFDRADKMRIAFIGENIIDEYRYVRGLGKASKEMMLAVVEEDIECFNGGAVAASRHGEWPHRAWIDPRPIETIRKTRYVDVDFNRKVFDVYSSRQVHMSAAQWAGFHYQINEFVGMYDAVVVFDFGHGLITDEIREILYRSRFLAVNAQSNAGNYGYNLITKYKRADLICVDDPEIRLSVGMATEPIKVVLDAVSDRVACDNFIITHGKFGSTWSSLGSHSVYVEHAPAFFSGGIDTMGAGDAVMAVAAPLVAAGLEMEAAAFVGNVAGGIKTSIVGHRRHVTRQEIIQTVEALLA